jgi:hypothetical protein
VGHDDRVSDELPLEPPAAEPPTAAPAELPPEPPAAEPPAAEPPTAPPAAEPTAAPQAGARPAPMTMADYEEAMSPRGQAARARGLAAPYIAGGRDPDPAAGRREERYYMRLLVLMVAVIVLAGFVISIVGLFVTGGGG